jgi:alkylation response protein AidB-like acyl-CoA dehydrogenase
VIDLVCDEDQLAVAAAARQYLQAQRGRRSEEMPAADLAELAGAGLFGLGLEEADGGLGLGAGTEVLAFEVAGAVIAPIGVLGSVLAAHALSGNDERRHAVLSGRTRVGVAEPWSWPTGPGEADPATGRLRVYDGAGAELLVVVGPAEAVVIEASSAGFATHQGFDRSVGLTEVDAGQSSVLARSPATAARATLLVAAMLGGIARETLTAAVSYAKTREAFGRPIGSFQAIKHRCVEMATRAEATDAIVRMSAIDAGRGRFDRELVHAARVIAGDAAVQNCRDEIQIFGGMGFTAEAGLDVYLRRALLLAAMFGTSDWHADRLVDGRLG